MEDFVSTKRTGKGSLRSARRADSCCPGEPGVSHDLGAGPYCLLVLRSTCTKPGTALSAYCSARVTCSGEGVGGRSYSPKEAATVKESRAPFQRSGIFELPSSVI